jgi:hypothetical protein
MKTHKTSENNTISILLLPQRLSLSSNVPSSVLAERFDFGMCKDEIGYCRAQVACAAAQLWCDRASGDRRLAAVHAQHPRRVPHYMGIYQQESGSLTQQSSFRFARLISLENGATREIQRTCGRSPTTPRSMERLWAHVRKTWSGSLARAAVINSSNWFSVVWRSLETRK